jgi:hypothetical protein
MSKPQYSQQGCRAMHRGMRPLHEELNFSKENKKVFLESANPIPVDARPHKALQAGQCGEGSPGHADARVC